MTVNALYAKITELEAEVAKLKAEMRQAKVEAFVLGLRLLACMLLACSFVSYSSLAHVCVRRLFPWWCRAGQ